jgi:hypothetical protein
MAASSTASGVLADWLVVHRGWRLVWVRIVMTGGALYT